MIKQAFGYIRAWMFGEDPDLYIDKNWRFEWIELVPILAVIGLIVYLMRR